MSTEIGVLIGSVLADITYARIRADVAAVQTAELYAQDPLLRRLTAPRFRVPEVSIEIPIALDSVEDGADGADFGGALATDLPVPSDEQGEAVLDEAIAASGLSLEPAEVSRLRTAVSGELSRLRRAPSGVRRGVRIGHDARSVVERELGAIRAERSADGDGDDEGDRGARTLAESFQVGLQRRVGENVRQLSRVKVRAGTSELASISDSSRLVRLRLTISEESLEMQVGDDGAGGLVQSLTPE